jgi:predicted ATPase
MQRIVLTGAPGAGKTTIATRIAERHPERFVLVPEAATQLYEALQTRWDRLDLAGRREVKQLSYHLQVEQEEQLAKDHPDKHLLLDRGTIDGAAYWPEAPADYWRILGTTHERELARYDVVILLQTCAVLGLYDGDTTNPCRFEDAEAAIQNERVLVELWKDHPNLHRVDASTAVEEKVARAEQIVLALKHA